MRLQGQVGHGKKAVVYRVFGHLFVLLKVLSPAYM